MATITTHHRGRDMRALSIGLLVVGALFVGGVAGWLIADSDGTQSSAVGAGQTEPATSDGAVPTEPVFTDAWLDAQVAQRQPASTLAESPFTDAWLDAQVAQRQPASTLAESPFTDAWLEARAVQGS